MKFTGGSYSALWVGSIAAFCSLLLQGRALSADISSYSRPPAYLVNGVDVSGVYVEERTNTFITDTPAHFADFQKRVQDALSRPYINGYSLVYQWKSLAPTDPNAVKDPTKYDTRPIDFALEVAAQYHKFISITIGLGSIGTPDYVLNNNARGCKKFTYRHPNLHAGIQTAPVPWTACYYSYLDAMLNALKKYDGNPNIRFISILGPSTLHGVETNWPMVPGSISPGDKAALGFTLDQFELSWRRSIVHFVKVFPNTPLALGLHNKIEYDQIQQTDVDVTVRKIRDFAIRYYARSSNLTNKKIILRLLGLTLKNSDFFKGPYDQGLTNMTDYVSLAWERNADAVFMYEGATYSKHPVPPTGDSYLKIFLNGYSWGGTAVDVGTQDLNPYMPQVQQIFSWYY